ncbi:class I SAM-dependent methyltransferase [Anaerofilum sp. BX8]|uniref:Class I SAM-dependent methyltransferase n=1 Tax=Anaerofilum hominis TaxID=2763016 RepID=A0A923I8B0_9FIRM|nr:class I SAM-dependent methyltransferase [Anaerofilum hominis]MBC5580797.1 class I SAM-dependent methyltransferase [Anaerofilum hominis]
MKENRYDDEVFFEKYSEMPRSKEGLAAAGEWDTLRQLLPDFTGKRVLDLGCGYGWHCVYAAQRGAASVVGVDLSQRMLEEARARTDSPRVRYLRAAMEDVEFPDGSFDVVLSSLALHYVGSFEAVVQKVNRFLKPGGSFVFSAEHPVFTACGPQDWLYDAEGKIVCFPVDNYYYEGRRTAHFLGEEVVKYHRTLTTYLNGLLAGGFELKSVVEPQPPQRLLDTVPGMRDELRRPMMLIVSAVKK